MDVRSFAGSIWTHDATMDDRLAGLPASGQSRKAPKKATDGILVKLVMVRLNGDLIALRAPLGHAKYMVEYNVDVQNNSSEPTGASQLVGLVPQKVSMTNRNPS